MRWLAALVAGVLAASVLGVTPAGAASGTFTRYTWPSPGAPGARDYWLYVPSGPAVSGRPLVVFLHGCTQTATEAAQLTRFNELADRLNFLVAYPQQQTSPQWTGTSVDGNSAGCWNWFLPENQGRDQGEAATIAGITRQVMADQQVDPDRVYVEGISAGADMAVNMGAAYPDLYAAMGAVAGCPYDDCADLTGGLAYRAMGANARVLPVFVEQGTADVLNNEAMGAALVQQWLGTDDLADDGAANGSVPRVPATTENHDLDQAPQPGSGDACIRPRNFPCLGGVVGFQGAYPYTVQRYADARGCDLIDSWTVHGLAHAYPGGDPQAAFTDPLGPDITTAAYQFFLAHPKSGGCAAS